MLRLGFFGQEELYRMSYTVGNSFKLMAHGYSRLACVEHVALDSLTCRSRLVFALLGDLVQPDSCTGAVVLCLLWQKSLSSRTSTHSTV